MVSKVCVFALTILVVFGTISGTPHKQHHQRKQDKENRVLGIPILSLLGCFDASKTLGESLTCAQNKLRKLIADTETKLNLINGIFNGVDSVLENGNEIVDILQAGGPKVATCIGDRTVNDIISTIQGITPTVASCVRGNRANISRLINNILRRLRKLLAGIEEQIELVPSSLLGTLLGKIVGVVLGLLSIILNLIFGTVDEVTGILSDITSLDRLIVSLKACLPNINTDILIEIPEIVQCLTSA